MSSTSTRAMYGASVANPTPTGGGLALPMFDGVMSGTGDFISNLSTLKALGARCMMQFVGGSGAYKDSSSNYSHAMWLSRMSLAASKTSAQQMNNFFLDGTLVANWLIDDFKTGSTVFATDPTFAEIESMASTSKSYWSMVPTMARAENQYMKTLCINAGASCYTYLDMGYAAWSVRFGAAQTHFANHVNDGRSVKLGSFVGVQLLTGGSGLTAPWNTHPNGGTSFGMSPQEIDACAAAFSSLTYIIGVNVWAQNPQFDNVDYWHTTSIQTALTALANRAIGRLQGPLNWQTSGSTSGSTQTVGGSWALRDAGSHYRTGTAASIAAPLPTTVVAGDLLGLLAYSRDSGRSSVLPSGWSEAQRVSGNSAQGGDLALYYKVAVGSEGGGTQTVAFNGTGVTGDSIMVRSFCFSGNTTVQGTLGSTMGSKSSWAAKVDMGVIKGVQSAVSDALVLICGAKANDWNNGDPPPDDTLSATTSGGESWNRLCIVTNASGNDAGLFIDWAALSGQPSITSKSWTQSAGTTSASSGAGCGFMATFRPAGVVAGTPPSMTNLEDITFSISSTLSFVLQSTGSTPITWSKDSGPSNITLNTSTGRFQWTPLSAGTYVIVVSVSNAFGSDSDSFVGTAVAGSNTFPVITNPGNQSVMAQDRLSFKITATDADSDPLTYGLETAPPGALVITDTGQFTWIPTGEQGPGTYGMVVVVSDGQNESRSTFTVTVGDTDWTKATRSISAGFTRLP